MSAIVDLNELLTSMRPQLLEPEYVFCSVAGDLSAYIAFHHNRQAWLLATPRHRHLQRGLTTTQGRVMRCILW